MPPWFIDIESATETDAKSNATPPASRTAAQVSRANSPSSALHGVTRPSVEATPTNGFPRAPADSHSARAIDALDRNERGQFLRYSHGHIIIRRSHASCSARVARALWRHGCLVAALSLAARAPRRAVRCQRV